MKRVRTFKKEQSGQGLVEFALVLPVLLLVTMGIIDMGRALFTYAQASNSLRLALRYGALAQTGTGGAFMNCSAMRSIAKGTAFASSQTVTITYRDTHATPDPVTGEVPRVTDSLGNPIPECPAPSEGDIEQGDILRIQNDVSVRLITPFFPQTLNFTLVGQRTIVTRITLEGSQEDTDFDGLSDVWECWNFAMDTTRPGTSAYDPNTYCPNDMMPDLYPATFDLEGAQFQAILRKFNATDDPDGDGCNNGCEEVRTTICTTNPCYDPTIANEPHPVWADAEVPGGATWGWLNPDSKYGPLDPDSDGDGLSDGQEAFVYGSDPLNVDSDLDGAPYATSPTVLQSYFGVAGSNQPEYATCQADDYEEAMGTPPYSPPSSSRTKDTDDADGDPATLPNGDNIDDWLEICRYHSDPTVVDTAKTPAYIENWPEQTLCGTATWGLQWGAVSPVTGYQVNGATVTGGAVTQCSSSGCPVAGPGAIGSSYYASSVFNSQVSGASPSLYFSTTVCSTITATNAAPNYPLAVTWNSGTSVCTNTNPANNYVTLSWPWNFGASAQAGDVDGFYIYADGYRVGRVTKAAYQAVDGCTGANSLGSSTACYNLAPNWWDGTAVYTVRPYFDTGAGAPMVGYPSTPTALVTCVP